MLLYLLLLFAYKYAYLKGTITNIIITRIEKKKVETSGKTGPSPPFFLFVISKAMNTFHVIETVFFFLIDFQIQKNKKIEKFEAGFFSRRILT